jgi:hypothetical protein
VAIHQAGYSHLSDWGYGLIFGAGIGLLILGVWHSLRGSRENS